MNEKEISEVLVQLVGKRYEPYGHESEMAELLNKELNQLGICINHRDESKKMIRLEQDYHNKSTYYLVYLKRRIGEIKITKKKTATHVAKYTYTHYCDWEVASVNVEFYYSEDFETNLAKAEELDNQQKTNEHNAMIKYAEIFKQAKIILNVTDNYEVFNALKKITEYRYDDAFRKICNSNS